VIQDFVPCWICHLIKLEYMAKMYYKIIKHVKRISEMIKAGENKVLRKKNLSHCHFIHHKFHMHKPGIKPGLPLSGELTNHMRHGTA